MVKLSITTVGTEVKTIPNLAGTAVPARATTGEEKSRMRVTDTEATDHDILEDLLLGIDIPVGKVILF